MGRSRSINHPPQRLYLTVQLFVGTTFLFHVSPLKHTRPRTLQKTEEWLSDTITLDLEIKTDLVDRSTTLVES